jgi:hypothetical protein
VHEAIYADGKQIYSGEFTFHGFTPSQLSGETGQIVHYEIIVRNDGNVPPNSAPSSTKNATP